MRVFKFGGASVKDADGVKNLFEVLHYMGHQNTVVIVSAMGKTTNALEAVVRQYFEQSPELKQSILAIKAMHYDIIQGLFDQDQTEVVPVLNDLFERLGAFLKTNKSPNYS